MGKSKGEERGEEIFEKLMTKNVPQVNGKALNHKSRKLRTTNRINANKTKTTAATMTNYS